MARFDAAPAGTITLAPDRFVIENRVGSERGTFVATLASGERAVTVEGVYVTIYHQPSDGRWRIAMEVRTTASAAEGIGW